MQIAAEDLHRRGAGALCQHGADLPLKRGLDQPLPGVLCGDFELISGGAVLADKCATQEVERCLPVHAQAYLQKAFALAAVVGQNPMGSGILATGSL